MKCLSLWQPWATLIIIGAKQWETRSWEMRHRGRLGIHAAKKTSRELIALCETEPFRSTLVNAGYHGFCELPLGCMLGSVNVRTCESTTQRVWSIDAIEEAFGDYGSGRYCFGLDQIHRYLTPIPAKGMQGLFNWPEPDF